MDVVIGVALLICQHLLIFCVGDVPSYRPQNSLVLPPPSLQYPLLQPNLYQDPNLIRYPFSLVKQPYPFQQSNFPFQQANLPRQPFFPSQQQHSHPLLPFRQPNLVQDPFLSIQRPFPTLQQPNPAQQPILPYRQPYVHYRPSLTLPQNLFQQPFSPFQQPNIPLTLQQPYLPQQPFFPYQQPNPYLQQPNIPNSQYYRPFSYLPYTPYSLLQATQSDPSQPPTCPLPALKCAGGEQAVCEQDATTGQSTYKCPTQNAERGILEGSSATSTSTMKSETGIDDASRYLESESKEGKRSLLESLQPVSVPPIGFPTNTTEDSSLPQQSNAISTTELDQPLSSHLCSPTTTSVSCPFGLCCFLLLLFQHAFCGQACQPEQAGCQPNAGFFSGTGFPGMYPFLGSPGSVSPLSSPGMPSSLGSSTSLSGTAQSFGYSTLEPQNFPPALPSPYFQIPSTYSKFLEFKNSFLTGGSDQDGVNFAETPKQNQLQNSLIRPGFPWQPDHNVQQVHPMRHPSLLQYPYAQPHQNQLLSPLIRPGFPQHPSQNFQQALPPTWDHQLIQYPLAQHYRNQPSIRPLFPHQSYQNLQQVYPWASHLNLPQSSSRIQGTQRIQDMPDQGMSDSFSQDVPGSLIQESQSLGPSQQQNRSPETSGMQPGPSTAQSITNASVKFPRNQKRPREVASRLPLLEKDEEEVPEEAVRSISVAKPIKKKARKLNRSRKYPEGSSTSAPSGWF